mgnify:CR=1 FL=1
MRAWLDAHSPESSLCVACRQCAHLPSQWSAQVVHDDGGKLGAFDSYADAASLRRLAVIGPNSNNSWAALSDYNGCGPNQDKFINGAGAGASWPRAKAPSPSRCGRASAPNNIACGHPLRDKTREGLYRREEAGRAA